MWRGAWRSLAPPHLIIHAFVARFSPAGYVRAMAEDNGQAYFVSVREAGIAGQPSTSWPPAQSKSVKTFLVDLARATGGAIIFALPIFMTMEMWYLGFYMSKVKLTLFMVFIFPVLVGLAYYAGYRRTAFGLALACKDAFLAYMIGIVVSAGMLTLMGVFGRSPESWGAIMGKIALQAVPASFGAVIARSQLGGGKMEEEARPGPKYASELLIMSAGAIFLAFNIAPTQDMMLIAYKMTYWHALAMIFLSLLIMHAFVYSLEFLGQEEIPSGAGFWNPFLRFTMVGYVLSLLISLYVLWTLDRTLGLHLTQVAMIVVVLGFPASIGAAAARLIL